MPDVEIIPNIAIGTHTIDIGIKIRENWAIIEHLDKQEFILLKHDKKISLKHVSRFNIFFRNDSLEVLVLNFDVTISSA